MSLTHIIVILDRSGSMGGCRYETVTGFDEFVTTQKLEEGEAKLTLTQFDHEYEVVYLEKDLKEVQSIKDTYYPRGSTALLDAIGRTIATTNESLVMKSKSQLPDRVLCLIITDGYENSSKEYNRDQIKKMIAEQEKGNWEFVFLGAGIDAVEQATSMGIKGSSAASYNTSNMDGVFTKLADKASMYRGASDVDLRNIKECTSAIFDDQDREDLSQ